MTSATTEQKMTEAAQKMVAGWGLDRSMAYAREWSTRAPTQKDRGYWAAMLEVLYALPRPE